MSSIEIGVWWSFRAAQAVRVKQKLRNKFENNVEAFNFRLLCFEFLHHTSVRFGVLRGSHGVTITVTSEEPCAVHLVWLNTTSWREIAQVFYSDVTNRSPWTGETKWRLIVVSNPFVWLQFIVVIDDCWWGLSLVLGMLVTPDFFIAKKRSTMQDFFTTTSCRSNASAALPVTTGIWHLPLRGVAVFRESPVHAPAWCSKLKEELQRWGNKFSRELFHLQYFLWCFCSLMCFSSLFLYLLLPFVRYQSNLEHAWSGGCHRMWAWVMVKNIYSTSISLALSL